MTTKPKISRPLLDLALFASIAAALAVLISKPFIPASLFAPAIILLMLAAVAVSTLREKRIEESLDEVELAGVSFGARWAISAVGTFMLLVVFVSPLQDLLLFYITPMQSLDSRLVPGPIRPFLFGLALSMVIYLTAKSALAAIWKRAKR